MNQWRKDNPQAPEDTLLAVRLPTPEQRVSDAERAAQDIADMLRRHGLA